MPVTVPSGNFSGALQARGPRARGARRGRGRQRQQLPRPHVRLHEPLRGIVPAGRNWTARHHGVIDGPWIQDRLRELALREARDTPTALAATSSTTTSTSPNAGKTVAILGARRRDSIQED